MKLKTTAIGTLATLTLLLAVMAQSAPSVAAQQAPGQLSGDLPGTGGYALAVWSGGPASSVSAAAAGRGCSFVAMWATGRDGQFRGLIDGAPGFVNQAFFELFPSGQIPAGAPLIIVCRTPEPRGPQQATTLAAVRALDVTARQRLALSEQQIAASSANSTGESAGNLVRDGVEGYWHVRVGQQVVEPSWVRVDLGSRPRAVTELRIRPRSGLASQLWDGDEATWQGSDDASQWATIARLRLSRPTLVDDWYGFTLPEARAYRYYRLLVTDATFLSVGRLEPYAGPAVVPPERAPRVDGVRGLVAPGLTPLALSASQLSVSSANSADEGSGNLVQPGQQGYWHVRLGQEVLEPSWVRIDLGATPLVVKALRIRPRAGLPGQLWDGDQALWQASNDGQEWTTVARLGLSRTGLADDWYGFTLTPSSATYRYYRLFVTDRAFLSLGRLELYR